MKHLFIVNPVSGGKQHDYRETVDSIKDTLEYTDFEYEIYITKAPMDACGKIREEAGRCRELRVYACGGDGTLNECVNGAAGLKHVAVTHYPCGTGNDFIKMFGEDAGRFRDLNALMNGSVRPLDMIKCDDRYSINICSVGIDARVGTDVHKYSRLPGIGGACGYVVSLLVNFVKGINTKMTIYTEDEIFSGDFALVCACNGRYYGGGFNPVPEAMPDDGIIDFLIVKGIPRIKVPFLLGLYAKGKYKKAKNIITHIAGKRIIIESKEEFVINVDGEALYSKTACFEVEPGKMNFIFPANMQFFTDNVCEKVEN